MGKFIVNWIYCIISHCLTHQTWCVSVWASLFLPMYDCLSAWGSDQNQTESQNIDGLKMAAWWEGEADPAVCWLFDYTLIDEMRGRRRDGGKIDANNQCWNINE